MVRPINKDIILLSRKSLPATADDLNIADDLLDTLFEHEDECVGMAANMIGELKRIIAVNTDGCREIMINPELIEGKGKYECEEGCLSLEGKRKTVRFREIKVKWQTMLMKPKIGKFTGFDAQVIQHELDHLEGIII